jgi:hypothetical protein
VDYESALSRQAACSSVIGGSDQSVPDNGGVARCAASFFRSIQFGIPIAKLIQIFFSLGVFVIVDFAGLKHFSILLLKLTFHQVTAIR